MAQEFRDLLLEHGFDPKSVKMLRHYNAAGTPTFEAWHRQPANFWEWASYQKINSFKNFDRPYWANFVATPDGGALFVGMRQAELDGPLPSKAWDKLRHRAVPDGMHNRYRLHVIDKFEGLAGKLFVDWWPGRNWVRNAENHSYPVI